MERLKEMENFLFSKAQIDSNSPGIIFELENNREQIFFARWLAVDIRFTALPSQKIEFAIKSKFMIALY